VDGWTGRWVFCSYLRAGVWGRWACVCGWCDACMRVRRAGEGACCCTHRPERPWREAVSDAAGLRQRGSPTSTYGSPHNSHLHPGLLAPPKSLLYIFFAKPFLRPCFDIFPRLQFPFYFAAPVLKRDWLRRLKPAEVEASEGFCSSDHRPFFYFFGREFSNHQIIFLVSRGYTTNFKKYIEIIPAFFVPVIQSQELIFCQWTNFSSVGGKICDFNQGCP